VTLGGEDIAQIKDLVYAGSGRAIGGFTLNGRGLFAGPLSTGLPWRNVLACGPDAVMVADHSAVIPRGDVVDRSHLKERDVLGARVITDSGVDLGKVVDVVIEVGIHGSTSADVTGYEIEASPALNKDGKKDGRKVLIPLPDTLAVFGEALIVPSAAIEFVSDDLAGFGAAVAQFRAHLRGEG